MPSSPVGALDDTALGDFPELIASWRRHLVAQRMSPATLQAWPAPGLHASNLAAANHSSRPSIGIV